MEKHNSMDERKAQLMGIFLKEEPLNAADEALCVCCTMDREEGAELCAAFTNEELLDLLRITARRLGHSPAQGECHWLLRQYLRSRFRNWPGALRAAGMRRLPIPDLNMPDWAQMLAEEPEICGALEDVTRRRCRLGYPPRKRDVPQAKILCERFRSWENVIAAAEHFEKWQEAKMDN